MDIRTDHPDHTSYPPARTMPNPTPPPGSDLVSHAIFAIIRDYGYYRVSYYNGDDGNPDNPDHLTTWHSFPITHTVAHSETYGGFISEDRLVQRCPSDGRQYATFYPVEWENRGILHFAINSPPPGRRRILDRNFQSDLHDTGSVIAFSSGIQEGALSFVITPLTSAIECVSPREGYKMHPQELVTRAQDITTILTATLPNLHFQAYTLQQSTDAPSLYLFAFRSPDVLMGGYRVEALLAEDVFTQRVVSIARFFNKIGDGEEVRFFPPEVQTYYEIHRDTGDLLHRIA